MKYIWIFSNVKRKGQGIIERFFQLLMKCMFQSERLVTQPAR